MCTSLLNLTSSMPLLMSSRSSISRLASKRLALLDIDPLLEVPCPDCSNGVYRRSLWDMLVTPSIVNSGNTTAPVENWNLGEVGKRGAGLLRLFGVLCPIFNAGELLVLEGLELEARDSLRRESLGYSSKFQPDGYFEVGVVAEDQLVVGG